MGKLPTIAVSPADDFSQWKQILIGLCDKYLYDSDAWEDYAAIDQYLDELIYVIGELEMPIDTIAGTQTNFMLTRFTCEVVSGNNLTASVTSCFLGEYQFQSPALVTDKIRWKVALSKGDYTLQLIHCKLTNSGQCKILVNGTQLFTLDMYNNPALVDRNAVGSFTLTEDTVTTIQVEVTGKNGASSSYVLPIQCIFLNRTE